MKTLNRPMFRMGGPIKEGVMHGIREPKKNGGLSKQFNTGLVGDERYPKTDGRAHHGYWLIPQALRMIGSQAVKKAAQKGVGSAVQGDMAKKGIQESIKRAAGAGSAGSGAAPAQGFWRSAWERDTLIRSAKWLKGAIMSPTAKGIGQKVVRGVATPTGALTAGWFGYPMIKGAFTGTPKTQAELIDSSGIQSKQKGPPGGGDPNMKYIDPDKAKKLAEQRKDERVNSLLKTMGYDTAKKDAISKALIDASQIVTERGTLDKKNITKDLINPIIAATSKRLEKPEQLNEAVRLMMTKAEIEKEMNPLDDAVKRAQLAVYQKQAKGKGIQETLAEATGKGTQLQGETLASVARSLLPGDFKVMQLKVPKNTDTLEHIIDVVKESHTNPEKKPFPPGQYVLKERIVVIDEQGNVTPLDI